jgi:hypothetical protein
MLSPLRPVDARFRERPIGSKHCRNIDIKPLKECHALFGNGESGIVALALAAVDEFVRNPHGNRPREMIVARSRE